MLGKIQYTLRFRINLLTQTVFRQFQVNKFSQLCIGKQFLNIKILLY